MVRLKISNVITDGSDAGYAATSSSRVRGAESESARRVGEREGVASDPSTNDRGAEYQSREMFRHRSSSLFFTSGRSVTEMV